MTEKVKDEELVQKAKNGDKVSMENILLKYAGFVRAIIKPYFIAGAGRDDIMQEGMIGLFKAIRDYRDDREASFRSFAEICVRRQVISAVKAGSRRKHLPLNNYIPLDTQGAGEGSSGDISSGGPDMQLFESCGNAGESDNERLFGGSLLQKDPEDLLISKEEAANIRNKIKSILSGYEREVLAQYLEGRTYREIAVKFGKPDKSVDNAINRIKNKAGRIIAYEE